MQVADDSRRSAVDLPLIRGRAALSSNLLSISQQRLWVLEQLTPGNPSHTISKAIDLNGAFRLKLLVQSLNAIVRRHLVLRTTFPVVGDGPASVVASCLDLRLPLADLSRLAAPYQDALLLKMARDLAWRPFDLAGGPLVRVVVLRLAPDRHVLLLTLHQIISDEWSAMALIRELVALYNAFCRSNPAPLPDPDLQYADYAISQLNWLQEGRLDSQLAYWKQQYGDQIPTLELPIDHPRSDVQGFRGARQRVELTSPLVESLRGLSLQAEATLFAALLTAFSALLGRYAKQDEIVVGASTPNRNRTEFVDLIGPCANMLALRIPLAHDPTFRALLDRTQAALLDAYARQDLPFERLLEELQLQRDLSRSPLFQVTFALGGAPMEALQAAEAVWSPLDLHNGASAYDLSLDLWETSESIAGWVNYNADLFDATTIRRMVGHFLTLLTHAVADPHQRMATIRLLTAAERRQILEEWSAAPNFDAQNVCLHQLFEAQAEQIPDAIAAVCGSERLTYRELNNRANQLAHRLRSLGVGAEARVGICVERSLAAVVGILGILKAGGAYVPLDPAYPRERLIFMLQDAQIAALVTQSALAAKLPDAGMPTLSLDAPAAAQRCAPMDNLDSSVALDNLAYVIYTSGSTGRPKGVAMPHRPLANLISWQTQDAAFSGGVNVLQFAPLSFDVSIQEIFSTWRSGGTLILISEEARRDPIALMQLVAHEAVEVLFLPVVALQQLAEAADSQGGAPARLRAIITAGEQLRISQPIVNWAGALNSLALHNQYGPSESHVVTALTLRDAPGRWPALPPIGRPIANTRIYLLDRQLQPVPIGIPGELHIGGVGLSRGYLNRPDLTAERFVPNPFAGIEDRRSKIEASDADADETSASIFYPLSSVGLRLYKTGDLARYLPDGRIEFLGRLDDQVKVRGYRIEPGEIENALGLHPAVRDSAVVAREDAAGRRYLAAYIVADQTSALRDPEFEASISHAAPRPGTPNRNPRSLVSELRDFLKGRLPEYMTPSTFMLLDTLPLTPSGKVDRRTLPAPDRSRPEAERAFTAPQTPTEKVLAEIWTDILGVERIGIHDNFFELGGYSLLGTRLIARIGRVFRVTTPLRILFAAPTIAGLATVIEHSKSEHLQYDELPAVVPAPEQRYRPFPLSDVQQAYWIGRSGVVELGTISCHVYTEVEFEGLDLLRFEIALRRLIDRHEMLRAIVLPDGQQQILEKTPSYQVETLDLRECSSQQIEAHAAAIRQRMSHQVLPSDQWPLFEFRATLLPERRVRLHISFDHLIGDAMSWEIIQRDLARFYQDPELPLGPLELSFRDYIAAEAALHDSDLYHRSLAYWQRRLNTLPHAPELPLATNPAAILAPRFTRRSAQLTPELWRQLQSWAVQANLTPSGVVLAAFAEVLTAWSKNPHFTLNLTLFHRLPLHPQVHDIVGNFTSLTLLAVDNSAPGDFEARARRIQEQLWTDLDHRYVSGVQVLRELMRLRRHTTGTTMPVVFTSTLNTNAPDSEATLLFEKNVVYSISQTPQVWIDHCVSEYAGALVLYWDAVEELFPPGLLDAMFEAYCSLLRALATDRANWRKPPPLAPAAQLEQRARINATEAPVPVTLLHSLCAVPIHKQSLQPAVIAPDRSLTYADLFRRSRRIGRRLQQLGVRPNTLVAVVMEKGWEQVVAVLGILQSGAAYLPIDPELPKARLWRLLEQGEADLVLTQPWLDANLAWPQGIQRVHLDDDDVVESDDRPLEPRQTPEDLAYVIFTSGSTGLPKGVMITHQSAVNTIVEMNRRFGIGSEDRVLGISSLSFDLSVYDIFGFIAAGGTIVIPQAEQLRDPAHWADMMNSAQVTVWNSAPALMEILVEYAAGRRGILPASLRLVLLSGDWIPVSLPERIKALVEGVQVVSLGGATEASIWSVLYPIEINDPSWTSIPYGKPMRNQQLHVLNATLDPCPVWVPGQLYIGGAGLAKGYWRDAAKTAERFVPNPFAKGSEGRDQGADPAPRAPRPTPRLYRTGDLARYLPDGTLEFLGREDFQVKIQGYRIELGEIEATLLEHPAVRAAVITAAGERRGNKRLVAYVICNQGQELAHKDLRRFLQERLPEYMTPAVFMSMEAFPLTPNGKVDRSRLPEPPMLPLDNQGDYVAPRTKEEQIVARIWQEALGLTQIGVYDSFFDIGGHSSLLIKVYNELVEIFQQDISMLDLFRHPTISSFVEYIGEKQNNQPDLQQSYERAEARKTSRKRRAQRAVEK